jgi:hypothetical protein
MMTLKPKDGFRLKQDVAESQFKGLELVVSNNGNNTFTVEIVDDSIVIKAIKNAQELFH